jgi:hypothetical protein
MYIAVIDYSNLDNPLFLKSLAQALAQIGAHKAIIIHSDSAYTDRLIQTGLIREEAKQRSNQDLNHRLVSFFADYGLACVGLNGFQRNTIKVDVKGAVIVNKSFIDSLPDKTLIILSCLVSSSSTNKRIVLPTPVMADTMRNSLGIEDVFVFSTSANDQIIAKTQESDKNISLNLTDYLALTKESGIPEEFKKTEFGFIFCKPLHDNTINSFVRICEIFQNTGSQA